MRGDIARTDGGMGAVLDGTRWPGRERLTAHIGPRPMSGYSDAGAILGDGPSRFLDGIEPMGTLKSLT